MDPVLNPVSVALGIVVQSIRKREGPAQKEVANCIMINKTKQHRALASHPL